MAESLFVPDSHTSNGSITMMMMKMRMIWSDDGGNVIMEMMTIMTTKIWGWVEYIIY